MAKLILTKRTQGNVTLVFAIWDGSDECYSCIGKNGHWAYAADIRLPDRFKMIDENKRHTRAFFDLYIDPHTKEQMVCAQIAHPEKCRRIRDAFHQECTNGCHWTWAEFRKDFSPLNIRKPD